MGKKNAVRFKERGTEFHTHFFPERQKKKKERKERKGLVEAPMQPTLEQNLTAFITPVDDKNITGFYYWFMSETCDCVPEQDQATCSLCKDSHQGQGSEITSWPYVADGWICYRLIFL